MKAYIRGGWWLSQNGKMFLLTLTVVRRADMALIYLAVVTRNVQCARSQETLVQIM
jgi:hypothetical protein